MNHFILFDPPKHPLRRGIFDLDGTILDSLTAWDGLAADYLHSRGIAPGPTLEEDLIPLNFEQAVQYLEKNYSLPPQSQLYTELSARLEAAYRTKAAPLPGAEALLAALFERNIPLCLLTASCKEVAESVLEHFGLLRYFSSIHIGDKRRPEAFRALAGDRPEATAVFDDSEAPLRAAKQAGCFTFAVGDAARHASAFASCALFHLPAAAAFFETDS